MMQSHAINFITDAVTEFRRIKYIFSRVVLNFCPPHSHPSRQGELGRRRKHDKTLRYVTVAVWKSYRVVLGV